MDCDCNIYPTLKLLFLSLHSPVGVLMRSGNSFSTFKRINFLPFLTRATGYNIIYSHFNGDVFKCQTIPVGTDNHPGPAAVKIYLFTEQR